MSPWEQDLQELENLIELARQELRVGDKEAFADRLSSISRYAKECLEVFEEEGK